MHITFGYLRFIRSPLYPLIEMGFYESGAKWESVPSNLISLFRLSLYIYVGSFLPMQPYLFVEEQ